MSRIEEHDSSCAQPWWVEDGLQSGDDRQQPKEPLPALFERLHKDLDELRSALDLPQHPPQEAGTANGSPPERERFFYQELFDSMPDAYVMTDRTGRIIKTNPAAAYLLQAEPPRLVGKPLQDFIAAETRAAYRAVFAEALRQPYDRQIRIRPAMGPSIDVKATVIPLHDPTDGMAALGWSFHSGETGGRTQDACRRHEGQLRLLIENIPDVVWTADQDGSLVFVSRSVETVCGYAVEEALVIGNRLSTKWIHPDDVEQVRRAYQALFADNRPFNLEYRMIRKGGECIWVNDRAVATFSEGGAKYAHGIFADITERRQAEEQARRHQSELAHVARLNTMGEMASMLAHELNQPLAAIVNYTQGCVRRLRSGVGDPSDLCAVMDEVRGQAERAGEIIRRLRRFVSKGEPRTAEADINNLVREVAGLADPEARQNGVEICLELAEGLGTVQVDAIQIQQVILNLVRNGIDAMSGAGLDKRVLHIRTSPAETGDEIEVAVSDSGIGIPPEIAEEIFSPFFTTKTKGMGVGLSFSRSLIEAHGGRLSMTPNPERGVTFRFTLPMGCQDEHSAAAMIDGDDRAF